MKINFNQHSRMHLRLALNKVLRDPDVVTWAITGVWAVIMLVLLMLPGKAIPLHMAHNEDKLYHFGMFAILSALAVLSVRNFRRVLYLTNSSFVMAFGAGFSIATELAQGGVPGRSTSTMDGLANIFGVFAGIVLTNLIMFYLSRPKVSITPRDLIRIKPRAHEPKPRVELPSRFYYDPGPTP